MQALVRCVARFGLGGATLAAIAKESGISRPLIRHHLGNREDIIRALQDFVLQSFDDQTSALSSALPDQMQATALIDLLFSESADSAPDMVLAFATLTQRSLVDPELRVACRSSILRFEDAVDQAIRAQFPTSATNDIEPIAQGIVALYFNTTSLAPLGMPKEWIGNARKAAINLLKTIEGFE
jgi:AcrR family transcriptional regulator